jgi:hypothetical protein
MAPVLSEQLTLAVPGIVQAEGDLQIQGPQFFQTEIQVITCQHILRPHPKPDTPIIFSRFKIQMPRSDP